MNNVLFWLAGLGAPSRQLVTQAVFTSVPTLTLPHFTLPFSTLTLSSTALPSQGQDVPPEF